MLVSCCLVGGVWRGSWVQYLVEDARVFASEHVDGPPKRLGDGGYAVLLELGVVVDGWMVGLEVEEDSGNCHDGAQQARCGAWGGGLWVLSGASACWGRRGTYHDPCAGSGGRCWAHWPRQ